MKNLTDRSADTATSPAQQPIDNPATEADSSASATSPHLFQRPTFTPDSPIRLPNGAETILDIFRKTDLAAMLDGASRHFLDIMHDMANHGVRPAGESFAHLESWWRENARAGATDSTRTKPGVKITAKDVASALKQATTGDLVKDISIDAGMRSRFARAAETYLIEGKAPSPEMRGVFEQFRDWLLSIYRRLVALNVSLAPDIAAIFFRLLACDTAIEMAQQDTGGDEPVFANAETAGLTQAQYNRLLKLRAQAAREAKAQLLRQMMEPVRREGQKSYQAEKAAVRTEVEREINATGLYRAIEWMANRRWLDDEAPAPSGDIRFDKPALVARYGPAILEALPRGEHPLYVDEGGLDPDIVADLFDLGSGDEMVAAMALAPSREDAIAFEVERLMLQRHGDMLIDGSAEERAIAAVHNDKRAQWLAAELKAIVEVAGSGEGLTVGEAEAYALSATAGMEVGDAMAGARFLAAGRRTGMEAARLGNELAQDESWRDRARRGIAAAGTSDAETTPHPEQNERIGKLITAKRRQLLNHAIYVESLKIIREVETFEADAEHLASGTTREKLAEASRRDDGRIDYLGAIDALLDRYGLAGPTGSQTAAQDDPRTAVRNYTLAMKAAGRENELAIADSVLITSGRQSYKEITLERFRAVMAALKNLEHAAERAGRLIDTDGETDFDETVAALLDAVGKAAPPAAGIRPHLDPALAADALLQQIGGGAAGAAYQAIKAPLDAAAGRLALSRQKAAADLQALYDVYSAEERREMAQARYLPALGRSLSKWDSIAIALNAGNEANRRRLTDARIEGALDEAGLGGVLASLDERDAGFVRSVWDFLASFQPDIAAREKRLTGIEPQWVQPVPVIIAGKALKGGYYPLAYDATETAPDLPQALLSGRLAKSQTEASHGRSRTDLIGRPLDLDIAVLHRHVNHLLYDLEFSEPLSNVSRLLDNVSLQMALEDIGREADLETLQAWLKETAAGELRSADSIGRMARLAKKNVTAVSLANDLAAALSSRYRLAEIIAASGRSDYVAALQNTFRPGIIRQVVSHSPLMAGRQLFSDARTAWETMAGWLTETLRYHLIEIPVWLAHYDKGLRQFGGDEARAITHADAYMQHAILGPFPAHAGASETLRLFTALGSHLAAKFKAAAEATDADAAQTTQQGLSLAMDLTALAMADTVFTTVMGGRHGDATWPVFLAQHTGYSVMAALPAIRDGENPPVGSDSDAKALANAISSPSGDLNIDHRHITEIIAATGLVAESPADEILRKIDAGLAQIARP